MHGNTVLAPNGFKTRAVEDVASEVRDTARIHAAHGRALNGLHLEVSGEPVTECLGGSAGITPEQLPSNYKSKCDPRLNHDQALEIAQVFAESTAQALFSPPLFENNNHYQHQLTADRTKHS
jgi:3-deoxy-7-phosphoheptulonate synthase